jgi:hypothetical protein
MRPDEVSQDPVILVPRIMGGRLRVEVRELASQPPPESSCICTSAARL